MGDIIVDSDESEVMPSDLFTSPQKERIDLDKLATSLGCSPVKNPGSRDKEPAAKRKASQLNSAVKSKVAKAFDQDESVLDTPERSIPPPKGALHLKPPKFEHIFVAVITSPPFFCADTFDTSLLLIVCSLR